MTQTRTLFLQVELLEQTTAGHRLLEDGWNLPQALRGHGNFAPETARYSAPGATEARSERHAAGPCAMHCGPVVPRGYP